MGETVQGLSLSHIRTLNGVSERNSTKKAYSENVEPAKVEFYTDGNLAKVTRELVEKPCFECGEMFKVERWRSEHISVCRTCRGLTGHQRGVISRFSENSRRRLMRKLATLHQDVKPNFVTLTFPDSYSHHTEPEHWKLVFKRFENRFRRAFPSGAFVWRLEVIDRKSGEHVGELFPHFHMLVFGVSFAKLRKFVPVAWYESVGTGDTAHFRAGTQVRMVMSRRGIMSYASKRVGLVMSGELAKTVQANGGKVGRWWGVAVRENFQRFVSEVLEIELTDEQSVHVLRYFRKMTGAFSRCYRSLTAFISGSWFGKNLPRMAEPLRHAVKVFKVSGRRIDIPMWLHEFVKRCAEMWGVRYGEALEILREDKPYLFEYGLGK